MPNDLNYLAPAGSNTTIRLEGASLKYNGAIHTHPLNLGSQTRKGTPLFSVADLRAVFKFANTSMHAPDRKPSEAFIGVVNKYGAYMVMIPNDVTQDNFAAKYQDFTIVDNSGRILGDKDKEVWGKMEKHLLDKYGEIENSDEPEHEKKKAHEKALLEVMKKYKLELNLYFLAKNEGAFNGSWQKLSLGNGQVQYTNIN